MKYTFSEKSYYFSRSIYDGRVGPSFPDTTMVVRRKEKTRSEVSNLVALGVPFGSTPESIRSGSVRVEAFHTGSCSVTFFRTSLPRLYVAP